MKWDENWWFLFLSPFLNIGITSAILRYCGKTPSDTHKLNKSLSGVDITVLLYLIKFVSVSFWGFDFLLLSSLIIDSTSAEVEGSKKKEFLHHFVLTISRLTGAIKEPIVFPIFAK